MKKAQVKKPRPAKAKVKTSTLKVVDDSTDALIEKWHPDDVLRKMIEGIRYDAESLIKVKRLQYHQDVGYDPIQQLEDRVWQRLNFLRGFDTILYWNFSDKINMVNAAFDALDRENTNYPLPSGRSEDARQDVIALIQHIGFNKEVIKTDEADNETYLKKIEAVNTEFNKPRKKPTA